MESQLDRVEEYVRLCSKNLERIWNILPLIAFLLMLIAGGIFWLAAINLKAY